MFLSGYTLNVFDTTSLVSASALPVQVRNEGVVKVPNATLTVTWPYALKDGFDDDSGKHILYLMREPVLVSEVKSQVNNIILFVIVWSETPVVV